MKNTLFTAMLAAALLGSGSAFAGTAVEGYDELHSNLPNEIYGKYAEEVAADLGFLRIREDENSPHSELGDVIGGYIRCGVQDLQASMNTIVMTSGAARTICGGKIQGEGGNYLVEHNTVIMAGGEVGEIYGGSATGGVHLIDGNKVVVTGGSVGAIWGAHATFARKSTIGNAISLVGEGAQYTHDEGQGVQTVYEGGKIQVGTVSAASVEGEVDDVGNSLNISGTGIQVGKVGADFLRLNFHMVAAQLTGTAPMLTVTEADAFILTTRMILSFDAVEGMEWKPGTSVTLVEAQKGMLIDDYLLTKEYDIYRNDNPDILMATAKLVLEQGQGTTRFLKLVVPGNVPEPATGTLSLLALAALAARRRKK